MNESLQAAIAELINKTISGVDASVVFLEAELPDYIYQLLLWYGVYKFIVFLVSALAMFGLPVLFVWRLKIASATTRDADEIWAGVTGVATFFGLIFGSFGINLTWLQIWIAPKVWLVEYAAGLVK